MGSNNFRPEDYTVGWVCALPVELAAASEMLDKEHPGLPQDPNDDNIYALGQIGCHNVVIACLPAGQVGTNSAATVAIRMKSKFSAIRFGLMVGVGAGAPGSADVRLGDVVVSQPSADHGGIVQYDLGTATASGFRRKGVLNPPPSVLLNAMSKLRANHLRDQSKLSKHLSAFDHLPLFQRGSTGTDELFASDYIHVGGPTCGACDKSYLVARTPRGSQNAEVHYGTIASGNLVIRDASLRDQLSAELGDVLCFEMEAAGLMNGFPCVVIRGICDYADSHKNKNWQPYAAATAASYAKDLLSVIPAADVTKESTVQDKMRHNHEDGSSSQTAIHSRPYRDGKELANKSITELSRIAYSLYGSLQGQKGVSFAAAGLIDTLFGLYCSLNNLSKYSNRFEISSGNRRAQTSNIFKRPGPLVRESSRILGEIKRLVEGQSAPEALERDDSKLEPSWQWILNQDKIEQIQAELEWCCSSVDILLDSLLRSYCDPVKMDENADDHHFEKFSETSTVVSETQQQLSGPRVPGKYLRGTRSDESEPLPVRMTETLPPYQPPRLAPDSNVYAYQVTTANPDSYSEYPFHILDTSAYHNQSRLRTDFPTAINVPALDPSVSPSVWINTIQLQLNDWEIKAAESSEEKRTRQKYCVNTLASLNSYIGSIDKKRSRRRLREELEDNGLMGIVEKMKAVVGNLVMLQKQVEVYNDDKEDDMQ